MKKTITIALILFFANTANATVGGPTLIEDIRYDKNDGEVYLVSQSYSGRGCPAEVYKENIKTGGTALLTNCDRSEQDEEYRNYYQNLLSQIEKLPKLVSSLDNLSLSEFNQRNELGLAIEMDISPRNLEGVNNETSWEWKYVVEQNITLEGKTVKNTVHTLCDANRLPTYDLYNIPDSNKVILITSSIRDCFEGGYEIEDYYILEVGEDKNEIPTSPGPNDKNLETYNAGFSLTILETVLFGSNAFLLLAILLLFIEKRKEKELIKGDE